MIFKQSILELIPLRRSVRNYRDTPLSSQSIHEINAFLLNLDTPFEETVRIQLIKKDPHNKNLKLGTYGVITGAEYFLAAACSHTPEALLALGYALEKVILYCTSIGLGTVWLGGTFNKGEFAKAISLSSEEILPIVTPVGYEGGHKSILATLIGDQHTKRQPFTALFFNQSLNTPLLQNQASPYDDALEMLRLAPSARNKQPWRVIKQGQNLHFYRTGDRDLNHVDMGIGLCHFHLTATEQHLFGHFIKLETFPEISDPSLTYVISWIV